MLEKTLLNFKTENFSFRTYHGNYYEKQMIEELQNDSLTQKYLPHFYKYIMETKEDLELGIEPLRFTSISYYEEKPIGLITFYNLGNELIFSHGVRPTQRGNRFSSKLKKEIFDYVFQTSINIERITVYIETDNTNNIHSLQKLNYDEIEEIYDPETNKNFIKVSNYNPYLKEDRRKI